MKYATVCSGIGAPEQAWKDIWGPPVFTSEIDRFPSLVLKHHMPDVPNHGDMTNYKEWPEHELELICGGTPCQAFSVAGLRKGLDDPRGNLSLVFIGIIAKYRPRWVVWENVPGVLSSEGGNDFGSFLSGLVGWAVEVPKGGWKNSGVISGAPGSYSVAWRILDAQHFGVPQRRRRVFVVGHLGTDWRPPFAVLFEPESLRGNITPGRKEGEEVAAFTQSSIGGYREGCGTIRANGGDSGGGSETLVMAHGQGNAEICKDGDPSLTCNHEAPVVFQRSELRQAGKITLSDKVPTLKAETKKGDSEATVIPPIAFMAGQGAKAGSVAASDKISPTIRAAESGTNRTPCVVHARQDPITVEDKALPLEAKGGEQAIAIHPHAIGRKDEAGPQAKPYRTDNKAYTHDSRGVAQAVALATGHDQDIYHNSIVRRLTPRECERLQGFPDDYTLIPMYGNSSKHYDEVFQYLVHYGYSEEQAHRMAKHPDGARYKALGNSMAVPVLKFIGRRIQLFEDIRKEKG